MLLILLHQGALAQGAEWSEKDLARSVHRAEQTFEGGEMSRAYGLFAHLVSVAGDRAFLHYRFGATCTYTSQRLSEAYDHLRIAQELGILETEYKAGWHYYMARYHQSMFQFDDAAVHLRKAIDLGHDKDNWMDDAKLRFGQCTNNEGFANGVQTLTNLETLVSHSDDYFRLYEMPVSDGRLLTIPDQLRTKEDKRREFMAPLHWLPGHRFAYYTSYGKNGDTGLDIYRVAVNGVGEYGIPEKLPAPVNSDFDDCNPICLPSINEKSMDRLFFSSSRPQSLGGLDIYEVTGSLTAEVMALSQTSQAIQLPFEINTTADEYLYWENPDTKEAWLTTNRNQDFEGREIWRFAVNREPTVPLAIAFQGEGSLADGRLIFRKTGREKEALNLAFRANSSVDLLLAAGNEVEVTWEANDGSSSFTELLRLSEPSTGTFASDPITISVASNRTSLQHQFDASTWIEHPHLQWSFQGMANRVSANLLGEQMNDDEFAAIKAQAVHDVGIEKVLQASSEKGAEAGVIPGWMVEAMGEIGIGTSSEDLPKTVTSIRQLAVKLQNLMEKTQCWDAPGSEDWKIQAVIERYGETALALLSEDVRQLRMLAQKEQDEWADWSDAVAEYIYQSGVDSEDWNVLRAFCEAQFQAYAGAYVHAEDMFRRIDSHLRFERWITQTLPMNIPAFRADLTALLVKYPHLAVDFTAAAKAAHLDEDASVTFESLQTALWSALTDEIIAYQELGIYTLPGMIGTQKWFIRSGGIVEELQSMTVPRERLVKGQQAVGLAWETYREGAERHDQVIRESEMSPGSWWQSFGPAEATRTGEASQPYAGYELFVKHNDPILEQAHAYQQELDILRTATVDEAAYNASLKKAIAMRSSIHDEMMALFGGERSIDSRPENNSEPLAPTAFTNAKNETQAVNSLPTAPSEATTVKRIQPTIEVAIEPATSPVPAAAVSVTSAFRYTVQVGAFANEPNFAEMPSSKDLFILSKNGKLTKYGSGKFSSHEDAKAHLQTIQSWAPDAFVKPIQVEVESAIMVQPQPEVSVPTAPTSAPEVVSNQTSQKQLNSAKTKQFRVRIVSYDQSLEPSEVATLLRLGNDVPLRTARMSNQTVYFSHNFDSLNEAKKALETCLTRGFLDSEIEVLYE